MKNNDLFWIDTLRVFATFSVILLHVAANVSTQYGNNSEFDWWVGNIYDSSVRFCVPIFLMISGALMLSKTYDSIGLYLKKRVSRILYPFLFWSLIYVMWRILFRVYEGDSLQSIRIVKYIFIQLKSGAAFHLWYIYMLIGLYLLFPIIGKWINNCKENEIKYFLLIWAITVIAQMPVISKIFPDITLQYFAGYVGFPVLGYYLITKSYNDKIKMTSSFLIIAGILITMIGTYVITKHNGTFYSYFYSYLSPNVIISSIGIFLLFKSVNLSLCKKYSSVIFFFSKYSYGIYLVHVQVLWGLSEIGISHSFINPIIGIPVTSILCFLISSMIIYCINKLPYGKYISG